MKTGIELIAEERQRQIEKEGWTKEHDAEHQIGVLAKAAVCYALPPLTRADVSPDVGKPPFWWPFSKECWKPCPQDRIKELVKAGALIAAEIDRIQQEHPKVDVNKHAITHAFLKCERCGKIVSEMYGEKFNNIPRNHDKYLTFLKQVELDNRFSELAEILQRYGAMPEPKEQPEVDVEKEIEKEIDRFWCSLFTDFTMERNPNHSPVFIPNPKYTKEGYRIAYALDIDWKDRKDFDGMAFGPEFLRSTARHFAEWGAIHLNARKEE